MGKICVIKSCPSGRKKKNKTNNTPLSLSYFQPRTPARMDIWRNCLGIDLKPTDYVCHLHFKADHVKTYDKICINGEVKFIPTGKKMLKEKALPTTEHQYIPEMILEHQQHYLIEQYNNRQGELFTTDVPEPTTEVWIPEKRYTPIKEAPEKPSSMTKSILNVAIAEVKTEESLKPFPTESSISQETTPLYGDVYRTTDEIATTKATLYLQRRYKTKQNQKQKKLIENNQQKKSKIIIKPPLLKHTKEPQFICEDTIDKRSNDDHSSDNHSTNKDDMPATMYEGAVCICCMSTDNLEELAIDNDSGGPKNYARVIETCFDIDLSATKGEGSICRSCIVKLNDASDFKIQIMKSLYTLLSVNHIAPVEALHVTPKIDTPPKIKLKPAARPRNYPYYQFRIGPEDTACKICQEEFANNLILKRHYNNHFPIYKCAQCPKAFMRVEGLRKHKKTHYVYPYSCDSCGQVFNALYSLVSHKRQKHKLVPLFKCKLCNQRFDTMFKRRAHLETDHGLAERKYACRHCDNTFALSLERTQHVAEKHHDLTYSCPLCEFSAGCEQLRTHLVKKHYTREKRHGCGACDKKFFQRTSLMKHLKSHRDLKRYECRLCGKSFVQQASLLRHIAVHIARGQYEGDPQLLMVYNDAPASGHLKLDHCEQFLDDTLWALEDEPQLTERTHSEHDSIVDSTPDVKVEEIDQMDADPLVEIVNKNS